tara:strand:+ start:9193 stop:9450 length:258 start_codon:yes stop_codon:yes gene_type:complete
MTNPKEYEEGYMSFSKNLGELMNPYPRGSSKHLQFDRGWSQGLRQASAAEVIRLEQERDAILADEEKHRLESLKSKTEAYKNRRE